MLAVLIWTAILSLGSAVVLLQGIKFWWEKDIVRGLGYTATAIFMAVALTAVTVSSFTISAVEKKFAEYGITKNQMNELQRRQ